MHCFDCIREQDSDCIKPKWGPFPHLACSVERIRLELTEYLEELSQGTEEKNKQKKPYIYI